MSRHTSNTSGGSDGSWFLEAVGAKEKEPGSIEAVERLELENTTPDLPAVDPDSSPADSDEAFFDGDPGTSTSSFHPVPVPPPSPDLAHPVDATDEMPIVDETPPAHVPDEALAPPLRSRRNFRWPIVIGLTIAIVAVVIAAIWLPRSLRDQALTTRQSYYDTAADLRNYLPTAQGGLDAITNPTTTDEAVSGAVPIVAEFDAKSFALETATAEPLPSSLPLVPSGPVDDLEPLQQQGSVLGATGSALASRIGKAYVYRTSIPALLMTGPLPISATTQEVNEISVRLAGSLADDAAIVANLPDDTAFAASHAAATGAVERYAPWQDEYLAALTAEDTDAAAALVDELDEMRTTLAATTDDELLAFRTEADNDIVGLAAELEAYLADLTRP